MLFVYVYVRTNAGVFVFIQYWSGWVCFVDRFESVSEAKKEYFNAR